MTKAVAKQTTTAGNKAAREAFTKAGGDIVEAQAELVKMVNSDADLYKEVLDPWLSRACYDIIRKICRDDRRRIWNAPHLQVVDTSKGMSRASNTNLMDFPLPGGLRLGQATRDEVTKAASFYETQARNMTHKSTWLGLIGQGLKANDTVEKRYTEERLLELQQEAEK